MAMVEKFTGVAVPEITEIARPSTAYAVTSPLLGLKVTGDEILGLKYPSPAVVAAVQSAASFRRRALAEWATRHALANAAIVNARQLQSVLAQLGRGTATRLTAEASAYRREADRLSNAATYALTVEDDTAKYEELRHWVTNHWAMEALAYTAERDDVTAALGATYCASIHYSPGSKNYEAFLAEAVKQINQ
jgi:regulator of protease activity HflC (stomatin/prohibitin superfamily)